MAEELPTFHWVDYLVFGLSLLLSAGIGVYYGVKPWCLKKCGKESTKPTSSTADQLLGGKNMKVIDN